MDRPLPNGVIHPPEKWPPPAASAVMSMGWLISVVPGLLVLGEVVAAAQGLGPVARVAFLQRLIMATALALGGQILWGHRLPGIVGPSAVLMVGALATMASGPDAVYGAMALGGALTAVVGLTGLAAKLRRLFTPAVLATTLVLIAVSLAPTMRDMVFSADTEGGGPVSLAYALGLIMAMFWAQHRLSGLASSGVVIIGMVVGAAVYHLAGLGLTPVAWPALTGLGWRSWLPGGLSLEPSVAVAFALCYLAVMSNELATVEATGDLIRSGDMDGRQNRAVAVTGLGGLLSGLWGVPGPVTYSVSPGMVLATRCASRWPLMITAGALVALALWPQGLAAFYLAPDPVVGAVLFFLMANSVQAALAILAGGEEEEAWTDGLVVGAAIVTGMVVAFMPAEAAQAMPRLLKPLVGNAFVMGLAVALALEHLILRRTPPPAG